MMQITYQKKDGNIIYRTRKTMLPYKVGEITSMGWKVLDIQYQYNGSYYSPVGYEKLLFKEKQTYLRKQEVKKIIAKEFNLIIHFLVALAIMALIKKLLGI